MFIRNVSRLLALFLLFSAGALLAQDNSVNPYDVVERYFEAVGGLGRHQAIKSVHSTANLTIEGAGISGIYESWQLKPDRYLSVTDLKVIKSTEGDNGKFAWEVDTNGKLKIKKDEETGQRRRLSKMISQFDHLNPESEYFKLTYEGTDTANGADCHVVKMSNTINDDVALSYYNVNSYLLEKTADIMPDNEQHIYYSDYRESGSIKAPFQQNIVFFPVGQKVSIELTEYEIDPEIDPAIFEPPAKDVEDFHFSDGFKTENIPFRFIENHLFIPVIINGREKIWVLDTGADVTVIDLEYARELGLEPEGNIEGTGVANKLNFSFVTLPPFEMEGVYFDSQKVAAAEFIGGFARKYLGLDCVGILGYDFLSRFVTKIDYARELISFYHPDHFEYSGDGKIIDAPLKGNSFSVDMTVNDRYSGKWSFDCGAGGCSFHYPFASEHGFHDIDYVEGVGFGAGGRGYDGVVTIDKIELAGFDVTNGMTIDFPLEEGIGAFRISEMIGNLGNTLFRNFVIYTDYKNQRLILEKGNDFNKSFPRDNSGIKLGLADDGTMEVLFVSKNTPGYRAGIREGDFITAVNDIDVEFFGGLLAVRKLFRVDPGMEYKVAFKRDGKHNETRLVLGDYFTGKSLSQAHKN